MSPTLGNGDVCITQKINLRLKRGDIIGFDANIRGENKSLVKRIIGLPEERVEIFPNSIVIRNSKKRIIVIEEIYLDPQVKNPETFSITLGEDEYCVLGDNRQISAGSFQFGSIHTSQIKYKFLFTLLRKF